ncbi:hypothetical protein [Metabacillus rhizolycopersici]|uniref:Uncharacterized protein n=1 Tax=Metabacillus rhizolycopersici TaxID=2875709 RepID=A0ABS7UXM6_9BACI|nr:hypothetical protein [Metabacillus rhizolycopersici]
MKVSKSDFLQDEKWESYLNYCDYFYFLLSEEARTVYYQIGKKVGLLQEMKNTLKVDKPHDLVHTTNDREKVCFTINKVLSKKFVYGY